MLLASGRCGCRPVSATLQEGVQVAACHTPVRAAACSAAWADIEGTEGSLGDEPLHAVAACVELGRHLVDGQKRVAKGWRGVGVIF